ncbi:hypothetical protein RHOSPDRAFT_35684 [Rhodotorula sp. JG-1b]|nr:hypothetical protein RHOSPDRAFT_35684 [Rhodotorula sp. JG-1b]
MVRFNHNVVATILALATTPLGVVLATPPPNMIEALSAYAAAGVTPTIAAGIKDVHRLVRRVEADEETPRADPEEIVILPPPGHRPYKQLPDAFKRGTRMIKEARGLDVQKSNTTTPSSKVSSSSFSAASTKAASKTSSSSAAATTSSRSIDSHHYWYIEDSPDQARWRKIPPPAAPEVSKRALGHFFDNLQDEFDRTKSGEVSSTGTSSAPTGFKKVSLRARAEASSISPIDSSSTTTTTPPPAAAPVSTMLSSIISPAERSASISQAADNLTWYDPTTWPSGIAAEVTQETDSIKDTIRKMNMLSKIGLATLVLVSTICLGFLIYCLCKMNMRRRRRTAAERVAAKMQANPPTRPYGGSATVPMASTGFSPGPTPSDKKGKRRMSWSRG